MLPSGVSAFAFFFADNSLLYDNSSRSARLADGLMPWNWWFSCRHSSLCVISRPNWSYLLQPASINA